MDRVSEVTEAPVRGFASASDMALYTADHAGEVAAAVHFDQATIMTGDLRYEIWTNGTFLVAPISINRMSRELVDTQALDTQHFVNDAAVWLRDGGTANPAGTSLKFSPFYSNAFSLADAESVKRCAGALPGLSCGCAAADTCPFLALSACLMPSLAPCADPTTRPCSSSAARSWGC